MKPDAIIPSKRDEDGCYDLYACFEDREMYIQPHAIAFVPTGIASAFPAGYRIALRERGSNAKSGLKVCAGQIDSGYRGEYFVALYNSNDVPIEITKMVDEIQITEDFIRVPYSKAVCQFAIEQVPPVELVEIGYDELKKFESARGVGKLGSSGK